MKNLLIILTLLVLPFKVCIAQDLDAERIKKDWKEIKGNFVKELQKDTKNFPTELFNKTSQGGDEPFKPLIDYFNKLEFNGKDFSNLKHNKFGTIELQGNQKVAYNSVVDKYIKQMQDKYKSTKPIAPKDKDGNDTQQSKTTDGKTNKDGNAKVDSVKIFKRQIADLQNDSVKSHNTIEDLNSQLKEKDEKISAYENKSFLDKMLDNWIIYLIALLELAVIAISVKKWYKADTKNEELRDRIHTLEMNKKGLKTQIETLKKQEPKEKIVEKEVEKIVYVEKPKAEVKTRQMVFKYLCRLGEGSFGRIDSKYDEYDSYYRIKVADNADLRNPSETFEFEFQSVNHEMAIQNWSSVLTPAADWTGDYKTAKHIENAVPGVIQYDTTTESWTIKKKAKLKLY